MMKKLTYALVIAVYLAAFLMPAPVFAGDNLKFSGNNAMAFFYYNDGCVETWAAIFANKGKVQNPPGPGSNTSFADVFVDQYDYCNGIWLFSGSGGTGLPSNAFQIDRHLTSATLIATIPVFNYVSENWVELNVTMIWTGTGPTSSGTFHSHFKSPGCSVNERFSGTFRPAQATGSISLGTTNFSPNPSNYADMNSTRSGSLYIGCN